MSFLPLPLSPFPNASSWFSENVLKVAIVLGRSKAFWQTSPRKQQRIVTRSLLPVGYALPLQVNGSTKAFQTTSQDSFNVFTVNTCGGVESGG